MVSEFVCGGDVELMRTPEELKERIRLAIIEEMNVTNLIAQREPENWIPNYIEKLTNQLLTICLDEISMRRR